MSDFYKNLTEDIIMQIRKTTRLYKLMKELTKIHAIASEIKESHGKIEYGDFIILNTEIDFEIFLNTRKGVFILSLPDSSGVIVLNSPDYYQTIEFKSYKSQFLPVLFETITLN